MFNISSFLQKFLLLEKNNEARLVSILDTLKKITGLELSKSMLDIKKDTLKINCNPVFRNEIFMHKKEIEEDFKNKNIFLKII